MRAALRQSRARRQRTFILAGDLLSLAAKLQNRNSKLLTKDNIVRFVTNVRPLFLYKLKMLRVASPMSKVQQRILTKKITKIGCGSVYNFKKFNRWQPLLVKRALVFS